MFRRRFKEWLERKFPEVIQDQVRVFTYRPLYIYFWGLVALVLFILSIGFFFHYLDKMSAAYVFSAMGERRIVEEELGQCQSEIKDLRNEMASHKAVMKIEQKTHAELEVHLAKLQERIGILSDDIAFYDRLMSPESVRRRVGFRDPAIWSSPVKNVYRYSFTIYQLAGSRRYMRGRMSAQVIGRINGEKRVYDFTEISDWPQKGEKLNFRYYQRKIGKIKLPENFEPHAIHISAQSNNRLLKADSEFDWKVRSD